MDKNLIRKKNLDHVRRELFQHKKMFASDLVKATGISMVTINSLLKELVADGSVQEGPLIQREIGRPAIEYQFNDDQAHSLLLSIQEVDGLLEIKSFVINLRGSVQRETTVDFSEISIANFQRIVAEELAVSGSIEAIGVLLPGKIADGVVQSSWYEKFDGWPIADAVKEVTPLPCYFQNDAHLITVGYCIRKNISLKYTLVGFYYPKKSMPGITIFSNRHFLEGHRSLAGEAKYLPGFMDTPLPNTDQELAQKLVDLLTFYNAAIAPDRFILATVDTSEDLVKETLAANPLLPKQMNQPEIAFVSDFQQSIVLGLHWLIYQDTPYDLSVLENE